MLILKNETFKNQWIIFTISDFLKLIQSDQMKYLLHLYNFYLIELNKFFYI